MPALGSAPAQKQSYGDGQQLGCGLEEIPSVEAACHCATNTLAVKAHGVNPCPLCPAAIPSPNSSGCQSAASSAPAPSLGHASMLPAQPLPPLTGHITLFPGHTASCDGDSVLPLGTAQMATAKHTYLL